MHNISVKKFVLLGLFPILVGCETLNHQTLTEQYNEPFLPIICRSPLLKNL